MGFKHLMHPLTALSSGAELARLYREFGEQPLWNAPIASLALAPLFSDPVLHVQPIQQKKSVDLLTFMFHAEARLKVY